MGGTSSTYDSKQKVQLNQNPEFYKFVEQVCNDVHNKIVSKSAFDTIMVKLSLFKIIPLARTPLGDNLFNVLTNRCGGKITSQQLYQFIVELDRDVEKRCEYTFAAFAYSTDDYKLNRDQQKTVSENRFVTLIVESWKQSFALLIDSLPEAIRQSDGDLIEEWSRSDEQIKKIKSSALAQFKNLDNFGTGKLEYQKFRLWVLSKQQDKIHAKYGRHEFVVPLTLYKFQN